MITDVNPYRELNANISPTEFEVFCLNTLKAYAKKENLSSFTIKHNQKIQADDGLYQIDVYAEYIAFGMKNTVLIECKKKTSAIKREVVAELYAKLQSIGANKGIIISTSGFQSGATQYANRHGISLWQICGNQIKHICASAKPTDINRRIFMQKVEEHLPKYFMLEWDCEKDYPFDEIYPTKEMKEKAVATVKNSLMDSFGGVYG